MERMAGKVAGDRQFEGIWAESSIDRSRVKTV